MGAIYLDYAAATPLDGRVQSAMEPYYQEKFFNPSAAYLAARSVQADIEAARKRTAGVLGARGTEIIFTAGGTEANNLAIHGIMRQFPGKKVVVGSVEHESVLAPAHGYVCAEVPVTADGTIDLIALQKLIDNDTALVSVMYANNEVGTVQPVREVAEIIRKKLRGRRAAGNSLPLFFHTDATQAANYLDLHVARLGVDLMTINGGKIYGPKQSGILYARQGVVLAPIIQGGGQEGGQRSGTGNVPAIIGFSTALIITQEMRRDEAVRLQQLQQLFFKLLSQKVPAATINGSLKKRLPNNVHIVLPGHDNERVLMELDEAGIMAAAGSACAASGEEPSYVLTAMGMSERDAQGSLRFTMGRSTTGQDIHAAVDTLAHIVA